MRILARCFGIFGPGVSVSVWRGNRTRTCEFNYMFTKSCKSGNSVLGGKNRNAQKTENHEKTNLLDSTTVSLIGDERFQGSFQAQNRHDRNAESNPAKEMPRSGVFAVLPDSMRMRWLKKVASVAFFITLSALAYFNYCCGICRSWVRNSVI